VRTGSEVPQVREVQVLGNQESRLFLHPTSNFHIRMAKKRLITQCMNVVSKVFEKGCMAIRKILVQLDLHRMCGTAGTGKFSSAEAAANAMAA
jgi:hypothetical protein